MKKNYAEVNEEIFPCCQPNEEAMKFLEEQDLRVANQSRYIQNYRKYALYQNTDEYRTAKTGIYRLKELLLRLIAPLL